MTVLCPHCTAALSTYTASVPSEPTNIEVLVCANCDKVLGVVGPARDGGRRLDVEEVADLLSVAVNTDDDDEARTVFMIAIDKIDSAAGTAGGSDDFGRLFERFAQAVFERVAKEQRQRDAEEQERWRERWKERPQ